MDKILILGGTAQQIKLIEAAKRKGYYTIVTDYLSDSLAKRMADKSYMYDINDIDGIVNMCKDENVQGVICGYIDPCQRPYQKICARLNLPCYGTQEQFYLMTDKHAFKKMCNDNGVNTIKEYKENDSDIEYPVFVKPVDSRGSRGQSVCYNEKELEAACVYAKSESSNGDIIIEKFMKDAQEFQVTYFFVGGKPYLIRTTDSYCGSEEKHLEKVVACAVSPSKYTNLYLEKAHNKVINMFKNMGYKNGPIFMQGFVYQDDFYFFDPGLRFPGVDYERIIRKVYGVDLMDAMIDIAMQNKISIEIPETCYSLEGKKAAVLFPTVSKGTIETLEGIDCYCDEIVSAIPRCEVKDTLEWTYNVNQHLAEMDVLSNNLDDLKKTLQEVQNNIKVLNEKGAFYCHVGGWEDEYSVPLRADKIVCDDWASLKHRGSPTIARMYEEEILMDEDIYANLADIISGELPGRESDLEFNYFNSIGLSFVDVSVAYYIYQEVISKGFGKDWTIQNADTFEVLEDLDF